jgi:CheY-like chemotaxis protein
VTGNALQSDIDTFLAAGADDVLTKPLDLERFSTLMREVM